MQRRVKIKICGMKLEDNIRDVSSLNPDYLGFIEFPNSPRFIDNLVIPDTLPANIKKVGVFVNASADEIISKAHRYDYIQLHGDESVELMHRLKESGLKIIKVFSVDDNFNFHKTKPYVPLADLFLFDTKGKLFGGNGKAFNWEILKHYDQEVPFFLSGGLSADNLVEIDQLIQMNLHGVDLNSGVESSPGLKEVSKVLRVIELIESKSIDITN